MVRGVTAGHVTCCHAVTSVSHVSPASVARELSPSAARRHGRAPGGAAATHSE